MENRLTFTQLISGNEELCGKFRLLMYSYIKELNEHTNRPLPAEFQEKWISSIIAMQGPSDRHLELCYADGMLVGFLYGKIDHKDHKGFIKPGYGYIMEFYVQPEFLSGQQWAFTEPVNTPRKMEWKSTKRLWCDSAI